MKSKILRMGQEYGGGITATFTVPPSLADEIHALIGLDVNIEAKKWRNPRSKDANALMWAVCQEIAEALHTTKIDVYRNAIRAVGVFEPLPICNEGVDAFCRNWESAGIGWLAEKTDKSKTPGYTLVFAYYGSSCYDSKQFSILVDNLLTDAKEAGITLKAGAELEQKAKELGI